MRYSGRIIWKLFASTFEISAFTFGGGYVIVPLMKKKFVDELGWLTEEEAMDYIAIAQTSPGAVAVNASILLGYRIAGGLGAFVAIVGTILPPMIILSVISLFYEAFQQNPIVNAALGAMRAGVSAVIISVVFDLGKSVLHGKNYLSALVMAGVFAAVYFFKINIILIILACAAFGVAQIYLVHKNVSAQ